MVTLTCPPDRLPVKNKVAMSDVWVGKFDGRLAPAIDARAAA